MVLNCMGDGGADALATAEWPGVFGAKGSTVEFPSQDVGLS